MNFIRKEIAIEFMVLFVIRANRNRIDYVNVRDKLEKNFLLFKEQKIRFSTRKC